MPDEPDIQDPRYLAGLRLVLARSWYDAHEELEGIWQEVPEGEWREFLQGIIQHVVALAHLKRGNALGAFNVWSRAKVRLEKVPSSFAGVEIGAWGDALERFYREADLALRVKLQLEGGVAAGELGERESRDPLPPLPDPETWPVPELEPGLAERVASSG